MAAYRKFSETWWSTPKNQDQGYTPPKAPKPPKAVTEPEPDTLGALGGLGGVPADFRKSEAAEGSPGTLCNLAALVEVPLGRSDSVYVEGIEQNRNYSSLEQATGQREPIAKPALSPPVAENQNCASPAAKAPNPPKVASDWEPATLGTLDALGGVPLGFRKLEEAKGAAPLADDPSERATIIAEAKDTLRWWAEGYAALCAMPPPSGFSPERWRRVVDAAGIFLDRWGAEAIRCGWSDLDLFGAHDTAPAARFDCMGLVMLLDRCEIAAIDRDGADLVTVTGARQRFRRRPLPRGTVALWRLGR